MIIQDVRKKSTSFNCILSKIPTNDDNESRKKLDLIVTFWVFLPVRVSNWTSSLSTLVRKLILLTSLVLYHNTSFPRLANIDSIYPK